MKKYGVGKGRRSRPKEKKGSVRGGGGADQKKKKKEKKNGSDSDRPCSRRVLSPVLNFDTK